MNKFFISLKNSFLRSIQNDKTIIIYSVIIAIIFWFFISITIYPTAPRTIENIKIDFDASITNSLAQKNNLSIISKSVEEVMIRIEGDRTRIGSLDPEDLVAVVNLNDVSKPETVSLNIEIKNNSGIEFTTLSIYPKTVDVKLDEILKKKIEISNIFAPNAITAPNYKKGTITSDPGAVNVQGPKTEIDKIGSCTLTIDSAFQDLTSDKTFNSTIYSIDKEAINSHLQLFNLDNAEIFLEETNIKIIDTLFNITIPVSLTKEMELKYNLSNVPSGFSEEFIRKRLNIDPLKVTLGSRNESLEEINSIEIGTIDFRDLKLDFTTSFEIEEYLKSYENVNNINSASVTLNDDGLQSKIISSIPSSNIKIKNLPSKYDATLMTQNLLDIEIIGPEDIINNITEKDIIVNVDLLNIKSTGMQEIASVEVTFPSFNNVWAYGKHSVTVDVKDKSESTTTYSTTYSNTNR
jgi:hypothetical protein